MKRFFQIVILSMGTHTSLWAQAGAIAGPAHQGVPRGADQQSGDFLVGSVRVVGLYDDNVLRNRFMQRRGDARYSIDPSLLWERLGSRLSWQFECRPGLTISKNFENRDLFTRAVSGDLRYLATPHLTLHLHDDYSLIKDPFEVSSAAGPSTTDFVVTPLAKRSTELGTADATYQLSPVSSVEIGGTFRATHHSALPGTDTFANRLIDSRAAGGKAFYARRLSARHLVGVEYNYLDMRFHRGFESRTLAQELFYFHQITFKPDMLLTLFVGPELTRIHDQLEISLAGFVIHIPLTRSGLSTAGGGSFDWRTGRNSLQFTAARRVGQGGGLQASVRATTARLEFSRELTPVWSGILHGTYAKQDVLEVTGLGSGLRNISAGAGIARRFSKTLSLRLEYMRVQQSRRGVIPQFGIGNHNRVALTLEYKLLNYPIGH